MRSFSLLFFFVVIAVASCKDKKQTDSETKEEANKPDTSRDTAQIKQTIIDFYAWYNKSYSQLQGFEIAKGTKVKDQPPYKIDWNEVDRMHEYMRTAVPFLGEEFIKNQRTFFQQADAEFAKDTESEIPWGFDYDWYTNSQEDPQYLLDEIKRANSWLITIADSTATADIRG